MSEALQGFCCISRGEAADSTHCDALGYAPVLGVNALRFSGRLIVICSQYTASVGTAVLLSYTSHLQQL
jgi:hypothetical protein